MRVSIFLCLILMMTCCVSFKIPIPDEPYNIVDYISIVKSISKEEDFSKRVDNDPISRKDRSIYAVVKVLNVEKPISVQWLWYEPEGKLVKQSEAIPVNENKKFLEFFVAWDKLTNNFFGNKCGKWTVVIILDNLFLVKTEFDVK